MPELKKTTRDFFNNLFAHFRNKSLGERNAIWAVNAFIQKRDSVSNDEALAMVEELQNFINSK